MERNESLYNLMVLSVVVALFLGAVLGHIYGYQQGIEYQKAQPVQITVDTYRSNATIHDSFVTNLTNEGFTNLWPQYVPNFTFYKITKYQGV